MIPGIFEKIVAIDWSGAQDRRYMLKIQVAEYVAADHTVTLLGPPHGGPEGTWSRTTVFDYVQHAVGEGPVLIGFDFAFAYPYCDLGTYFPGEDATPPDRQRLWATVEDCCNQVGDFYGGPFYRGNGSPFADFHRCHDFEGGRYQGRYRMTDQAARQSGLTPSSIFWCVGPSQVGPGSVAGMRFLLRLQNATGVSIWPFDANDVPMRATVAEIYPRLFLHHAEIAGVEPTRHNLHNLCAHFGAALLNPPENPTDDQRDALVSAAGMGWFVQQGQTWQVPACAAEYEGWIFGVA